MSSGPYHISLLNDLHQWFPDILYHPTRFHDVQDLLAYIRQVADVNPYTQGLQQYVAHQHHHHRMHRAQPSTAPAPRVPTPTTRYVPPSAAASAAAAPSASRVNRSASMGQPPPRVPLAPFVQMTTSMQPSTVTSSLTEWLRPSADSTETTYEYTATTNRNGHPVTARIRTIPLNMSVAEDDDMDSLTEQTMTSILTQLLSPGNLRSFLEQTVEVAPTEQEIAQASTLETPTEVLEDNCAICQDAMEAEQALRRLHHCRHVFHKTCIDTWFCSNVHCPTCRHDIRDASAPSSAPPPVPPQHRRTNIRDPSETDN